MPAAPTDGHHRKRRLQAPVSNEASNKRKKTQPMKRKSFLDAKLRDSMPECFCDSVVVLQVFFLWATDFLT